MSLCRNFSNYDLMTSETPPRKKVKKLCQECKDIYYKEISDRIDRYNNRSLKEKNS